MIVSETNIKDFLKKEDSQIEWKEKNFDSNNNEIAKALSSIDNRFGGTLLLWVKNNGELEEAKLNEDKDGLRIINIVTNNCSPPVICSTNVVNYNRSDVLVITIQKRNDMPYAVI